MSTFIGMTYFLILNRLELSNPPLRPPALVSEVAAAGELSPAPSRAPDPVAGASKTDSPKTETPQTKPAGGINGQYA